ncbi:MAG TPA: alkaline phosphatase family protein [Nocardioidaceae bacterium]|nr:alkaline phosphatase family protein [Nocardioidaceae bacterium]
MRNRSKLAVAALGAAALVGSTLGASAFATGGAESAAARARKAPRLDHIFVIMLENHSKSSVIGDKNAPYMNKLANTYQMADHYYGVTHPSMPNYIATISGSNWGIQDDNAQNIVHLSKRNLVDQLDYYNVPWAAYMEDLPKNKLALNGPTITKDGKKVVEPLYAKKHNPFVLFRDVKQSPRRLKHIRDYSRMKADLNGKNAPHFVWITPNQCNDMHGGVYDHVKGHPETPCPYGSKKDDANDAALKAKADAFVKQAVKTIRTSDAWTRKSAIIIVTDENDYTGNPNTGGWENARGCCDSPYVERHDPRLTSHDSDGNVTGQWRGGKYGGGLIPAIIVSPQAPRHLVDHHKYNHYSLLTTIEDNWGFAHLGHAGDSRGNVHPMWKVFLG